MRIINKPNTMGVIALPEAVEDQKARLALCSSHVRIAKMGVSVTIDPKNAGPEQDRILNQMIKAAR